MAKKNKEDKVQRVQLSCTDPPDWIGLMDKLWETVHDPSSKLACYRYYRAHQPEKVRLSQEGWDQIKRIIVERGICVEVFNSCMGFSCSLVLYKDREEPYPGAEMPCEVIFEVCSHMLPGNERSGFKEGWSEFGPLFNSPENIERLKWNKRPMPREAYHYDY